MADAKSKKEKKQKHVLTAKGVSVEVFLIVEAIITVTAVIINLLAHSPWYVMLSDVALSQIICGYVLILWQPVHRRLERDSEGNRHKLTRTYKLDVIIFFLALCFFYSGYRSATSFWQLALKWGIGTALGVLGLLFYYKVYGKEDYWAMKIKNWMWKRRQKVYRETGMTEAEILEDTKGFCEFHFVGDTLEGLLDVSRPLHDERLTYAEMVKKFPNEPATLNAERYLKAMVHDFCEAHPDRKKKRKGGK